MASVPNARLNWSAGLTYEWWFFGLVRRAELRVLIRAMVVCFDGVVDVINPSMFETRERTQILHGRFNGQPVRFDWFQLN
jgi:hypothetical protein